jgi:hypothetical protein
MADGNVLYLKELADKYGDRTEDSRGRVSWEFDEYGITSFGLAIGLVCRRAGLEEAAKVCESAYAFDPSSKEDAATRSCAAAIRALQEG